MGISGVNSQLASFLNQISLENNKQDLDAQLVKPKDLLSDPEALGEAPTAKYEHKRSDPNNLMSKNFLDPDKEQSKYIKARLNSFAIANEYANKQNSIIEALRAQKDPDSDKKYSEAFLMKLRAERMMQQRMNSEVTEESKAQLRQNNEDLDQAANKALGPKDADGNPIEQAGSQGQVDNSGAIKAAIAQSSSAVGAQPETAISQGAPVTSGHISSEASGSFSVSQTKVSINIKV